MPCSLIINHVIIIICRQVLGILSRLVHLYKTLGDIIEDLSHSFQSWKPQVWILFICFVLVQNV